MEQIWWIEDEDSRAIVNDRIAKRVVSGDTHIIREAYADLCESFASMPHLSGKLA